MRKNKMMRIASALLVAVLLSTCAISGTFAKYVTAETGTDTARVAKWGVTIIANGETFTTNYNNTAISSETSEDIVAPGTNGNLVAMELQGAPEVKVEVKYESELTLTDWNVTGDWDRNPSTPDTSVEYCPIVFTVGSATYGTNDTSATNKYGDVAALITAVQEAIADYTHEYDANVDLGTHAETPVVSWAWDFDVNDDAKDTALGNWDLNNVNAPKITLSITTTVTQVD